jgi:hypothetical protein
MLTTKHEEPVLDWKQTKMLELPRYVDRGQEVGCSLFTQLEIQTRSAAAAPR